jgi:hypothetical protein
VPWFFDVLLSVVNLRVVLILLLSVVSFILKLNVVMLSIAVFILILTVVKLSAAFHFYTVCHVSVIDKVENTFQGKTL